MASIIKYIKSKCYVTVTNKEFGNTYEACAIQNAIFNGVGAIHSILQSSLLLLAFRGFV